MSNQPFKITNNGESGIIHAKKEYFERDCILRVVSEYSSIYDISFYPIYNDIVEIIIKSKNKSNIDESILQKFFNDCIDEQIRIDLQKEFGNLRQRIVDYAFSSAEKINV